MLQTKISMLEAKYSTMRADYLQLMETFCNVLQQESRIVLLEDKIRMVYEKLVALTHAENIIHIESEKWDKYLSELKVIKDDIHSSLEKAATEILKGKFFRAGD